MSKSSNYVKIKFLHCFFMLILVTSDDTLDFHVHGSGPLVVPLGGSVVLPCYVETPLVVERVKVEWRRTDSEALVHLFLNGDIIPEAQHQDYHDRAHFFTEDIKHGNFSLMLKNVREDDTGIYRCKVYTEQAADKTLVEIKYVEYLIVSGSQPSISFYVGDDVTLSCSVKSHIKPEKIEEVSWRKINKDEGILVLLYQHNETQSESSDERYRDRVEFFTDEIHRGNFSLRLKRLTTEDKGSYICQVFTGRLSANTTVILQRLDFSGLVIMKLILCITACVSALLVCSLIYCRPVNKDIRLPLQVCLHFFPNILLLLASVLWGATEGGWYETISCCMLCILRPLRLLWLTPYINDFPDKIMKYIQTSHADQYFPAVMVVMFLALLAERVQDINTIIVAFICVLLVLVCLLFIIQLCCEKLLSIFGELCRRMFANVEKFLAICSFYLLPSIQLSLLLYPYLAYGAVFFSAVLPVLAVLSFFCPCWSATKKPKQCWRGYLDKAVWILMSSISVIMAYFYTAPLRNKEDDVGLVCLAGFFEAIWVLTFSKIPINYPKLKNILFLFGSVVLVLVNSVALNTELILNAGIGDRLLGDLRIVVFPSECVFTIPLLILPIFTPWVTPNSRRFDASIGEA